MTDQVNRIADVLGTLAYVEHFTVIALTEYCKDPHRKPSKAQLSEMKACSYLLEDRCFNYLSSFVPASENISIKYMVC